VVEIDFFFLEHKDVHAIASGIVLCGVKFLNTFLK